MANTPLLDLNLPTIGADRDTWGSLVNENFSALDTFVSMAMPVGSVIDFAGPNPPSGWLVADGRLLSRVTYSALFAVLGTSFSAGDGSTTFGLPNLQGRSTVGPGTGTDTNGISTTFAYAARGGAYSAVLAQANLPNITLTSATSGVHNHGGSASGGNHTHSTDTQGNHAHGTGTAAAGNHNHPGSTTDWQGSHSHAVYVNTFGGGGSNGQAFAGGQQSGQNLGYYTDTQGNHYHNLSIATDGWHNHAISYDGSHAHNLSYSGNISVGIATDNGHTHTVRLGGAATPLTIVAPYVVLTKIIYAGTQAAMLASADAAPTRVVRRTPLRGLH